MKNFRLKYTKHFLAAFLLLVFVAGSNQTVFAAISAKQKQYYLQGIKYFDVDTAECTSVSSAGSTPIAAGSDIDKMTKAGMAPEWAALIAAKAQEQGVDPLAMASLTYWEHRGFLPWNASGRADVVNGESDTIGRGPWQIIKTTWGEGNYSSDVYDYDKSTAKAAGIVASYGGKIGSRVLGSIEQDFSKGNNIDSIATLGKNYNAGVKTYRTPGVAKHKESGRIWSKGTGVAWGSRKDGIIDDYVVGLTYVYYQMATGQKITYTNNKAYIAEGISKQAEIAAFKSDGSTSGAVTGSCKCTALSTDDAASTGKVTVVLDPGHSVGNLVQVDPGSGVITQESGGAANEMQDMWDATQKIKTTLEGKGYNVVLTKNTVDESIGHLTRVLRADAAKPAIAVSMHYDGAGTFGQASANYGVTPQTVGQFRENISDAKRKTFTNQEVATKSQEYAGKIAAARTAAGDPQRVVALEGSFGKDRGLPAWGNIPNVMLFSNTPWVYNEAGGIGFNSDIYAKGIADGIMAAVPTAGGASGATSECGNSTIGGPVGACITPDGAAKAVGGDIVQTALLYAWPDKGHGKNKDDAKPEYQAAKEACNPGGEYSDCGRFVSTVMRASGKDPDYPPGSTGVQEKYVKDHPEKYDIIPNVTSTAQLKPGDIFVAGPQPKHASGHTYFYVGPQESLGGGDAVSASLGGHVPQKSGTHYTNDGRSYTVARLK